VKTQDQARREFAIYYEEVNADSKRDGGGGVHKSELWDMFINHGIEEERFPADATNWKMPRSTKKLI
jgi:hypothetical protein